MAQSNLNAWRIVMVLTFVVGYGIGCFFPILRLSTTAGLFVPAWILAIACYAGLIVGVGCMLAAAVWCVSKLCFFILEHFGYWDDFLAFYIKRLGKKADDAEGD